MEGLVLLINGPDEARAAVRKLVKDGVEWIKTYPTGDAAAPDTTDHHTLCMTFEEMHAVVAEAHNYRLKVTGHCRATEGIKNALRAGFDTPRARHVHGRRGARHAAGAQHAGRARPAVRVGQHRARPGVRHAAGGDRRPQGNARRRRRERPHDPQGRRPAGHGRRLRLRLEPARRLRQGADVLRQATSASRPLETITCATKTGAEIMGREDEIGTLEPGKLADVLVVDGDVLGRHRAARGSLASSSP